ncbi:MFS transporter [Oceanicola sp. S124]|uniref:MFS transporter n=1 Tax=Oceanicola sp. S124 TaxID=1042378 RepID=UPI0002559A07|nr:MFS transporter [Oceanicola sp. S124]
MITWVRVIALFVTGMAAAAQFGKVSVLFPAWEAAYPQAGAAAGFLVSLVSLMGVLLGLLAGMVVTRMGFRRTLIGALVLGALVSGLQALMPPLPVMLGLRALEGLSHLAIVVAAPTLMAEITSDRSRPLAMTLWGTYFGVTFALYAAFGPLLLAAGGVPLVLGGHAGFLLLMALVLPLLLPDDRRPRDGVVAHPGEPLTLSVIARRHREAYASPFIAAPGLGWLFYAINFVALMTVLPSFLPEATREMQMTVLPLVGIVSALTLGSLALKLFRAVPVAVLGFLLAALSVVLLVALPGTVWVPAVLFIAMGFMQSGSFAAVPQINADPADRALSNGVLAQMGNLGNLTGTPILLAMTGAMDFAGLVLFSVTLFGMGAVVHLVAARMRARSAAPA